jgi:hypothetical protein
VTSKVKTSSVLAAPVAQRLPAQRAASPISFEKPLKASLLA